MSFPIFNDQNGLPHRYKITEEALEEFNTDPVGRVELNLKTGKVSIFPLKAV